MLSYEEKKAIEDLKEIIDSYNDGSLITIDDYDIKSIDIVLNLIEKQSKEIEELKENMRKRIIYCNEIEKDLFENCSNYVVSKTKIKEKIEELKKYSKEHGYINMRSEINVLQSLLEKE